MSQTTRRQFGRLAAGAAGVFIGTPLSGAPKINSVVRGVTIGAQSYSFRDRSLDAAIQGFKDTGLGLCEMWQGHMERDHGNRGDRREELRKWRLSVSLDEFEAAGKKFREAGIDLYAYNYSFRDDFTDAEIERGFEMAKALGAKVMTASSNVSTSARIAPFAKKHKIRVGMHNHSRIRENEFATPEDFERALKGRSDYIAINLDIGHFTAANFDAVDYIHKHHDDIVTLHLKDRKRNQGDNLPFGQGDTPIKEVLALLRERKSALPANIEYEYKGADTVEEVRKCFQYCKRALES
jgi:sugar phosphate isomerase/epimerase